MATIYLKDEINPQKKVIDKRAVRRIIEQKDVKISDLLNSNKDNFFEIQKLYLDIENLRRKNRILLGSITFVTITIIFLILGRL